MLAAGADAAPRRPKMVAARDGALASSGSALCWAAAVLIGVDGHAALGEGSAWGVAATWGRADTAATPPKGLKFFGGCRPIGKELDGMAAGSAAGPLPPPPKKVGMLCRAACFSASIWAGVISSSSAVSESVSDAAMRLLGVCTLKALWGRVNNLAGADPGPGVPAPCSLCNSCTQQGQVRNILI